MKDVTWASWAASTPKRCSSEATCAVMAALKSAIIFVAVAASIPAVALFAAAACVAVLLVKMQMYVNLPKVFNCCKCSDTIYKYVQVYI